jgi:hypothetical protein
LAFLDFLLPFLAPAFFLDAALLPAAAGFNVVRFSSGAPKKSKRRSIRSSLLSAFPSSELRSMLKKSQRILISGMLSLNALVEYLVYSTVKQQVSRPCQVTGERIMSNRTAFSDFYQ